MAGANIILKPGQSLFKEGEQSDGMYIIRKGELLVYLEKGATEIKLASVGAGSMIGEMSLFDQKPRSASAKAVSECEITKISNEDFNKLMKQIPKWFVTLMASLSTRLRETNERVQSLEAKASADLRPLDQTAKLLHVLGLVWAKDGTKQDKNWEVDRELAEKTASLLLGMKPDYTHKLVDALAKGKVFGIKPNQYKKDMLAITNRGNLERFAKFIESFSSANPQLKAMPPAALELMDAINKLAQESAYDSVTVALEDAVNEGKRNAKETNGWKNAVTLLKSAEPACTITKLSNGGIGFKVDKKELPRMLENFQTLDTISKAS